MSVFTKIAPVCAPVRLPKFWLLSAIWQSPLFTDKALLRLLLPVAILPPLLNKLWLFFLFPKEASNNSQTLIPASICIDSERTSVANVSCQVCINADTFRRCNTFSSAACNRVIGTGYGCLEIAPKGGRHLALYAITRIISRERHLCGKIANWSKPYGQNQTTTLEVVVFQSQQ